MATRSFSTFVEQEMGRFTHFVIYVLLEWVLIFILFLDGFLAFAANEYARFFELHIPCWLCTRFDHVLVHRNHDFYYNESVCEAHKKDMSSLAFCHNHKKLSDIRKMCEGCLLSFATEKESDCDTYKSLVGILHKDLECFVQDGQPIQLSLKDDGFMQVDRLNNQRCSCCGEPLKMRTTNAKVKHSSSFARAPNPSPRAFPFSSKNDDSHSLELPHMRYKELKFMSYHDSELQEDDFNINSPNVKLRDDHKSISMPPVLSELDDLNDESSKFTPTFTRGNKFFGIPLTDSANNSPRWTYRISRKSPLEKTEFASESNEVTQSDFDDAVLSNLNRQVRLDRKSLMALYMELDEERSASAVAANNAMAMITRLQAEKAAVQMEALQYQRMMEEQAEYDEEALQASTEEVQALQAELEVYKKQYGCLAEGVISSLRNSSSFRFNEGNDNQVASSQTENGGIRHSESVKAFKAERAHLLGRIKKVESRNPFEESGVYSSLLSSSDSVNNLDNEKGKGGEIFLPKELSFLAERVKALEANSGFLDLVSNKEEKDGEGTKILTEISQNLEKLSHLVMNSSEVDSA
ncbi:probable myosin-binding protein 5 [Vigna unguiculata]|uniref:probable myosin-binding protein 5 n=1 Tax=Vigna unguiculata TaxID=3917 RepID=UPI001016BBA1|nr:probable myosin-binding protein 5 [Vigna unguiculata]